MFICSKCKKEYAGYPKVCPECRCELDGAHRVRSERAECASLADLLSKYDTLIAFDTETTGLDFKGDRVIELSAVLFSQRGGVAERELDLLIKLPEGQKIPPEIVKLTGITDEMLLRDGVDESEAVREFLSLFRGNRHLLVAHNAQFDMNFLYRMLARHGAAGILCDCDMLDTLTVYKDRREYPHRLENAIDAYKLTGKVKNSHRAIDDTLALFEVMKAMDAERPDLGSYINLFGYNPKYGVSGAKIGSVKYIPQPYNSRLPLYYKVEE